MDPVLQRRRTAPTVTLWVLGERGTVWEHREIAGEGGKVSQESRKGGS